MSRPRCEQPNRPPSRSKVALISVRDRVRRNEIAGALREGGWEVGVEKSGYHLVQTLSGTILGDSTCTPDLIVADVASHGVLGSLIADGLRDLGWETPVFLLTTGRAAPRSLPDGGDERTTLFHSAAPATEIARMATEVATADRALLTPCCS